MKSSPRILVIRFSSLGDLVLTTPIFREIKRCYPEAHVTLLSSDSFGQILENNPHIDTFHYHPRKETLKQLNELIAELKQQHFDIIYDAHRSLRSRWVCWGLAPPWKGERPQVWKINKRGWRRSLLIRWKVNLLKAYRPQREQFLEPLQHHHPQLALEAHTELYPSEAHQQRVDPLLPSTGKKRIAIGPSASFPGKCWPVESFREVIETLLQKEWEVILLGSAGEEATETLANHFGDRVLNVSGQLNVLESTVLLQKVDMALCNDTAIGHLAEAVGTPAIVIFGPTVREFGYAPFLEQSQLLETTLPCRPCTRNGKGPCKIKEDRLCLRSISVEKVLDVLDSFGGCP